MPRRRSILALVIAGLAVIIGPHAWAGIPSPANSTVDPCLRVCPAGDMNFHLVVRDALANPIPFSAVVIDLCACSGVLLCPLVGSEPYSIAAGCNLTMMTDATGVADLPIRAGGTCSGGPIRIFADGVLLASLAAVSSPDQSGDAVVNATDQGILAVKLGGPHDPTADFNCSAALESGDQGILNGHLGHSCNAVVPVWHHSWGLIKTIYR